MWETEIPCKRLRGSDRGREEIRHSNKAPTRTAGHSGERGEPRTPGSTHTCPAPRRRDEPGELRYFAQAAAGSLSGHDQGGNAPAFPQVPLFCQMPPAPSPSPVLGRRPCPPASRRRSPLAASLRGRGGPAQPRPPPQSRTRGDAGRCFTCEGAGSLQGGGGVQLLGVLAVLIGSVNQPLGRRQGGVSADGGA